MKAKVKRTRVGVVVDDHWEAEGQLTLDENGSFVTVIPASYRYNTSYAACPQSGAGQASITLMGAYDAADNKLVLSLALENALAPSGIAYWFPCSISRFPVHSDLHEVSIALEDGAHSISSGHFAGETWEISLDLSYDTDESTEFPLIMMHDGFEGWR